MFFCALENLENLKTVILAVPMSRILPYMWDLNNVDKNKSESIGSVITTLLVYQEKN